MELLLGGEITDAFPLSRTESCLEKLLPISGGMRQLKYHRSIFPLFSSIYKA